MLYLAINTTYYLNVRELAVEVDLQIAIRNISSCSKKVFCLPGRSQVFKIPKMEMQFCQFILQVCTRSRMGLQAPSQFASLQENKTEIQRTFANALVEKREGSNLQNFDSSRKDLKRYLR